MPTHTHRTTAGDVDYSLERRRHGGNWHYRFWWQGKEFRASTKTHDHALARLAAEKAILLELQPRDNTAPCSVAEAVKLYLETRWPDNPRKDRYFRESTLRLEYFKKFAGGARFCNATTDEARLLIQRFLDGRIAAKKSARTVTNDYAVISACCQWLLQRKYTRWLTNPAAKKSLQIPKPRPKPKLAANEEAVEALLVKTYNRAIYPVIVLMCSGLRLAGCTRVRWCNIHLGEKPFIEVPAEKGASRNIPLSEWAAQKLSTWKLRRAPSHEEARVYAGSTNAACRLIRELTEKQLTFGALRRLTYTRLYKAGVNPQLAAKIMGNSIAVALKHYVDLSVIDAHEAVIALNLDKPAQKPAQDPLKDNNPAHNQKTETA